MLEPSLYLLSDDLLAHKWLCWRERWLEKGVPSLARKVKFLSERWQVAELSWGRPRLARWPAATSQAQSLPTRYLPSFLPIFLLTPQTLPIQYSFSPPRSHCSKLDFLLPRITRSPVLYNILCKTRHSNECWSWKYKLLKMNTDFNWQKILISSFLRCWLKHLNMNVLVFIIRS